MSFSQPKCAAYKLKCQNCTKECVFTPYFTLDQPQKFASIYEVYEANNIAKILNELSPEHGQEAMDSLVYEAEERIKDPIYGCVGLISVLQHQLNHIQNNIQTARTELANYMGPQAMIPMMHQTTPFMPQPPYMGASASSSTMIHHQLEMMPSMEFQTAPVYGGFLIIREPQQQQQQPHQLQQRHLLHPHNQQQQQFWEEQLTIAMGTH